LGTRWNRVLHEAGLESKLQKFETDAKGRENREAGKKRTAGTARFEGGIDFSNRVTMSASGDTDEALKILIGEAMIEDGLQHLALTENES
jgi:hypothetical protein